MIKAIDLDKSDSEIEIKDLYQSMRRSISHLNFILISINMINYPIILNNESKRTILLVIRRSSFSYLSRYDFVIFRKKINRFYLMKTIIIFIRFVNAP